MQFIPECTDALLLLLLVVVAVIAAAVLVVVKKVKVEFSHYRPGVAQRVGRGIALLFHDRGTRRG